MHKALAVTLLLSSQILQAQGPGQRPAGYISNETERRLAQESFENWAAKPDSERQAAARREAQLKLREFFAKADRFVSLWKKLSQDMNDHQTFNVKLAKEVSKAFHDMEKSEGWPSGRSK
jgi:hypothetical protein